MIESGCEMKKGDYAKSRYGVIRQVYDINDYYIYFKEGNVIYRVVNKPDEWTITTGEEYRKWLRKKGLKTK